MSRVVAKFVPCLMTADQKEHRIRICQKLIKQAENEKKFLTSIITGDKS